MRNKLYIKNFGPIEEANINITPLTIFIGPNSSGKSYSSLLIHSLLNSFNKLGLNLYSKIRQDSVNKFLENNDEFSRELKDSLKEYMLSKPKLSDEPFKFPAKNFEKILENSFGQIFKQIVEEKLKGNFTNNLNKLNRLQEFAFEFTFNQNSFINKNGNLKLTKYYVNFDKVKNEGLSNEDDNIASFEIDENFLYIKLDYLLWHNFFKKDEYFIEAVFMKIVSSVMDTFNQSSFYLSAMGDELFKDMNYFISDRINRDLHFSNIQKELITTFLKLEKHTECGPYYNLACALEQELLGGSLYIKKGEIKDELIFLDKSYNMELELGLTSSSIRELSFLIIHLKYFIQKGDTLIIEEPENHIHPKNQLILVKFLVKAINQGVNIIITTHSDYIIEKFNNFIRLGNANEEFVKKSGYEKSNILNHEKVSIYNFKKEGKYSYTAKSININETGFDEDSFNEVNNELYEESVDIIDAEK